MKEDIVTSKESLHKQKQQLEIQTSLVFLTASAVSSGLPRRHRLVRKACSTRHRIPPYPLQVREGPELYETVQTIAIAHSYSPELHGKILLLRTFYTMSSGYGDISHTHTRKLLPFYTAFRVLESSVQFLGERNKNGIKSNSTGFCLLQYPSTRQDCLLSQSEMAVLR